MKIFLFLLLNIYSIYIYCQSPKTETPACPDCPVGINTSTIKPGLILQVDNIPDNLGGVLFPMVKLESGTSISPFKAIPDDGTIIYNTMDADDLKAGYYFWDSSSSSSSWNSFESINKNNDIFESSNQDTSTNFNTGTNWMDLFANVDTDQNSSLYSKVDAQHLTINETGFYRVVLNLNFKIGQPAQDEDVFGIALFLNGVQQTDRVVIKTKEYYGGTQSVAEEAILYLYIPSGGATLAIRGFAIHGASQVYFNAPGTSTINIERIR